MALCVLAITQCYLEAQMQYWLWRVGPHMSEWKTITKEATGSLR